MPWAIQQREGRYCVIKESDGSSAGCHDSRTDAIKQQRALYANESRMASMYDELDAEEYSALEPSLREADAELAAGVAKPSELVRIEIGKENEALTASLIERMEAMDIRAAETQTALVAALHAIGTRESVVNVEAPNVDVAAPNVTVESPSVTVEAPNVSVEAPNVSVNPEIILPSSSKTITFERDPLTGHVSKADVTEGGV